MKKAGIVAFAFGTPYSILSNRRIEKITSHKAREMNAPIYTQSDIRINTITHVVHVEYIKEKPDNPPPTLRIARGAVKWGQRNNLTVLWIVAAQPHLWRCIRDLKFAIRESRLQIEVHVCREIYAYPEDEWFCPDSTQLRTSSRKEWEKRERIIKLMPMFLYKLIAS